MKGIGAHTPNEVFPCTRPAASRYNGVRMRPEWNVWVTEIQVPKAKKRIWLGSYPTAEMAARAYDAAVVCLKGPNDPKLNFPNSLISPDQVRSCSDLKDVIAIAKAAAYAATASRFPAAHGATHDSLPMVETRSVETSSRQVARPSHGGSDSGHTHDQTAMVTHPGVYVPAELGERSIGRRWYPIEADLIYSPNDLILFDYIQPGEESDMQYPY